MKKRIIIIAVILAAILLMTFRYSVIEQNDILPEDLRYGLNRFFGSALAETEMTTLTDVSASTEPPVSAESSASMDASMSMDVSASPDSAVPVPTPLPTPEPLLERGDSGEEVKALQQRLRELGFMTSAADGKFGPKTEAAVIEFRKHLYELEQERLAAQQADEEIAAAEAMAQTGEDAQPTIQNEAPMTDAPAAGDTEAQETPVIHEGAQLTADIPAPTAGEGTQIKPASTEAAAPTGSEAANEPTPVPTDGEAETVPSAEPAGDESEAIAEPSPEPADGVENASPEPVFEGKVDEEIHRLLIGREFDEYQMKLMTGSRGAEVKRLQGKLKALGYLTGKADGIFGKQTKNAVIAFQRQHKLTQDGIAGEKTQRALYSLGAKKYVPPVPKQPKGKPYLLKVSTKDQRVYAYSWNEKKGAYTDLVRTMVCSTGLAKTPTPKGTYTNTTPVVRWGYFPKYDVWAQYLYRISGPYLFHSVLYDEADESTVKWGSVNKLGTPASHGCIRLKVEDAKWIYNNCPAGTTVTVY